MSAMSIVRQEMVVALLVATALAALVAWRRPADRASARNTLIVLVLCAVAEVTAVAVSYVGAVRSAAIVADVAAVVVGLALIRVAGILVFRMLLPALHVSAPRIVEDLVITGLFIGWGFVWLRLAGVDLASLVTTSAIITAVVAFSMQDTLGNILGGVVLQLDNSIRVGDWVRIDDVSGQVVEVRWRYTAVETRNRETVMFPNSWLMKNRFSVLGSRNDPEVRWRRWVWFNIELGAAPNRVCAVLERAVLDADIDNVAKEPPPSAVLMEVGQGYGRYALRYWLIDPRPDDPTDSAVRAHALAALARNGMRIGIPQEERLIFHDDEARRRSELRAEEIERRRRALAGVDLFASLSDEERDALAGHLVYAPFVMGDTITRQGAVAHWLYFIVSGEADVWVDLAEGRKHITTLPTGSVFGEMGMMTGEPRRATVTAKTDVECYRLDAAGFENILRQRPDIAAEMSQVLAARAADLQKRREMARVEKRAAPLREDILARIRSFFHLDAN